MLLGTGAPQYEELFRKLSYEHKNFIFTNGQSEKLIDSLYLESDLYFMPSLFEPCGISQMLAMRNGNPCLVHHTGGLKDTVDHMVSGFSFDGDSYDGKLKNMLETLIWCWISLKTISPHGRRSRPMQKKCASPGRSPWMIII